MNIKLETPSGKTIQAKVNEFLRSAQKSLDYGMSFNEVETGLKQSLVSIIGRSYLVKKAASL